MYAHKGRTKKLKCHGLHGFALDQPSINGNGMNWSKLVQLIVQKNETVGNGRKHDQAKTCPTRAQRRFFFEGPKVSKGKRLETVGDRTFARQESSSLDLRLFPTVSPWTPLDLQKKKRHCAEMLI